MEPFTHEEEKTASSVSHSATLFSGIRAVPSREDSDSETVSSKGDSISSSKIKNKDSSGSSSFSSRSSSDKEEEEEEGFVSGEEELGEEIAENPMVGGGINGSLGEPTLNSPPGRPQVPIAKVSADEDESDDKVDDDDDDEDEVIGGEGDKGGVSGGVRVGSSSVVGNVPKVRALRVERLEAEEDTFETAVADSRYSGRVKFDELVNETGRVVGKENEDSRVESGKLGNDKGVIGEPKGEISNNQVGSMVEECQVIVANGAKFTDKGDSVVEAIHVNSGEALRTGAAIVGDVDESKGFEAVRPVETSAVGVSVSHKPEVGVVDDVKFSDKGAANVDSTNVDLTEVVRSGTAVVGQVGESRNSQMKEAEKSLVEEFAPTVNSEAFPSKPTKDEDAVGGMMGGNYDLKSRATYESATVPRQNVPENSGIVEVDGMKFTNESDSMVESIKPDPENAIRARAADVGSIEKLKGPDMMERNSAIDESEETDSTKHEADAMFVKQDGIIDSDATTYESPTEDHSANTLAGQAEIAGAIDNMEKVNSEIEQKADSNALENIKSPVHSNDNVAIIVSGEDKEEVKQVVEEVKSWRTYASVCHDGSDDVSFDKPHSYVFDEQTKALISGGGAESKEDEKCQEVGNDVEGDVDYDNLIFGGSAAARQFIQELKQASGPDSQPLPGSSHENSQRVDGQIITDSEEEVDSEEEQGGKELFDSAALADLLKAANNASGDPSSLTLASQDGTRLFSIERPAGLGPSLRSIRPQARPRNSTLFNSSSASGVSEENLSEEEKKKLEKMQQLRVEFLRLARRLGHSTEDSIAAQVLYRLALLAGRPSLPSFTLEAAKQTAGKLEKEGKRELNFSLNILVLGKLGVGKSATINSIFGEEKVKIDAFEPGTTSVDEICGVVSGVTVRVFDTPGLRSSSLEQGFNRKVLASVKRFTKKSPPDIILYVDRLDAQTRDLNDLPLLRTITSSLGSSIWRNAIVTLTHGACAPPDGPSGSSLSYEVFVAQRSRIVQQYIGQAVGDLRLMNPSLMNPVSLVENHPACRKNREGRKVLPNGQTWRTQLLLLCFSMKILSEATSISKSQDSFDHRKLFGFRAHIPPLPYLLSSLLQPRPHPKLSADQGGENGDSDIDLEDLSDIDQGEEEEDEYDQLPPFKPLRKGQLAKLSKDQRKAYFEEYDYRVKLRQKKQWKEELRRMREMKKNGKVEEDGQMGENFDPENGAPAPVPVPLPDMALPATFDGDNPAYRYRFLEPSSQFLARPVLDTHGWDHDCGYDGVNLEQSLGIAGRFPANMTVQVTKDKKEFNLHLDSSIAAKHGENGSTLAGFDIQNIGKQLAYIVRGETKFKNLKRNKTAAGISVTFLGENVATGVKVEDQVAVGKRLVLVGSMGTVRSQKDTAYGANLEVRVREADYPIGQEQSSFVLSLMKWRGDLALGANLQSQVSIGRNSKMAVRVALNNKMSGQITVKTMSSDHLQLALAGLIPIALSIYRFMRSGVSEGNSIYF